MSVATLVEPSDRPVEAWGDASRGPIRWKTLLSKGLTDSDSLTCGIAMLSPGDHFAEHRHPQSELYFGIDGEVEVMVDGVSHALRPETALFIPGDALHGIRKVTEEARFLYAFAVDAAEAVAYDFPTGAP